MNYQGFGGVYCLCAVESTMHGRCVFTSVCDETWLSGDSLVRGSQAQPTRLCISGRIHASHPIEADDALLRGFRQIVL